ncbi:MAG: exonuclease sbcCD subunit D, partial [Odoribacter splanchnicus]|nr:exonuclease sbcCD subunit D [Odoribacter splanchnicus]
ALLITGDIFDVANPSTQTQKQFYRFMKKTTTSNLGLQIVVMAGNHDSVARLWTPIIGKI